MKLFIFTILIATYFGATFSQQSDKEYEDDGKELERYLVGCNSDALADAMKISEAAGKLIPPNTPNCGNFKKFSKDLCPPRNQWTAVNCGPRACQVTDDLAFTKCKLPVKLLVPYPIKSNECRLPGRFCGGGCTCQTIWCVKWFYQYVKNDHGCFLAKVWKKYPCKCECRKKPTLIIPVPPYIPPGPWPPRHPIPSLPWPPKSTTTEEPEYTAITTYTLTMHPRTVPPWTTEQPYTVITSASLPMHPRTVRPWTPMLPKWMFSRPDSSRNDDDDEDDVKWQWINHLG